MIYITGDIHGDPFSRFSANAFPEGKQMTKEDFVIVCGDFGCVWEKEETPKERYKLDWLDRKPFTTLFVDGNHENHDRLDAMDISAWHGGKAHFIRPSVIHLMRGQFYEGVGGMDVFAFGGASSHDIWNLLDPKDKDYEKEKRKLHKNGIFYRTVGETWWEREMPSDREKNEGLENLKKHGNKADLIITHECPKSIFLKYYKCRPDIAGEEDILRDYLEKIYKSTDYGYWFFGHHHDNVNFSNHDKMIYEQIARIC